MSAKQKITITRPDDWHVHFRQGPILQLAARATARCFARAMVMPNTTPPITNVARANQYHREIVAATKADTTKADTTKADADKESNFTPLLSLYLTEQTTHADIKAAADAPYIVGCKLYPAHATTGSQYGVSDIKKIMPILECMAEHELVLQVHGEVTDPNVDAFDREAVFIETILEPLHRDLPELKIILEHITTTSGVEFVRATNERVAATITVHHLMFNRNAMFHGGLRPHMYCLPVLKREHHRRALLQAATSGSQCFFLGSDSAPHPRNAKQSECGCAGIYSAPAAIELYAQVFAGADALDKLEGFASWWGADFYGRPRNKEKLKLIKKPMQVAANFRVGNDEIVPLLSGAMLEWSVEE